MNTTIISPQTGAVTTEAEIRITDLPATIGASNLATTETVTILFSVDNGATWEESAIDGITTQLTATNKIIGVYSPVLLAVTKSATAAASGVYLTTSQGEGKV